MSDNLKLWNLVERTDPSQTKPITGKSYQGTSPKPHYLVHKATETFGPIGIGWGFNIVSERIEDGAGGERMHIAQVRVWYEWEGKRGEVEHIGGTQFSGVRSSGKPFTDEDAPKKSVTDALVKALSMIGFAGDIFMGRYDDSKYVNSVAAEFAAEPASPTAKPLLKKDERLLNGDMRKEIEACGTVEELTVLWKSPAFKSSLAQISELPRGELEEFAKEHADYLRQHPARNGIGSVAPNFDDFPGDRP